MVIFSCFRRFINLMFDFLEFSKFQRYVFVYTVNIIRTSLRDCYSTCKHTHDCVKIFTAIVSVYTYFCVTWLVQASSRKFGIMLKASLAIWRKPRKVVRITGSGKDIRYLYNIIKISHSQDNGTSKECLVN